MSVLDDLIKKASESREQPAAQANPFLNGYKANEQKVWSDSHGNVNITDLGTGVTRRHYDSGTLEDVFGLRSVNPNKASPTKDSYLQDTAQALADHLHAQRASYKSALGSAARGIAGLVHGDNNYQPEVGSWLWRMQEGYEAEKGVSEKLREDSKYGKGWLHGLAMDLTGGAVDLAGDRVLDLVLPGAGLVAMDIRSFGDSAGQSQVQGKSISTQMLNGAIHAAIGHFAEKAGTTVGRGKGTPAWGERLSSAIEGRLEQKGASKLVQKLIMGFGEEAAEEMLEDVLNPAVSKFVAGIDKGDYDAEEFPSLAEIAYDGLVGGLLGLMGGATEGIAATRAAKNGTTEVDVPVRENGESNTSFASRVKDYIKTKANEHVDTALERAAEAKRNSEATSSSAPQSPAEAQSASAQQVTPEDTKSAVKQEAGEFNDEPDAEQPKQKHIGEKSARDIAFDAWFNDNVRQDAEPEGVAVDSSDFANEVSTSEPENGKVEARNVTPTAAERLANYDNPQTTDVANRGLKDRVESAVRNALAQNGIDYSNDPRAEYYDENAGEYREEDLDLLDEESRAKYLSDMRQIRLLDAVDEWLDKNGQKYLSAKNGSEAEVQQGLQDALNDYVRRYLDSQTDKTSNSEAVEDVMQQRRQDDRLKSLAKEEKREAPTGYNTVQVGDNLFRVTGPGGITTTEVADNSADAVQKHIDGLTEENRKKAKERKEKEKALKQLRKEVQESQENPTRVDGSDGKAYEVTKELTKGENNYQYVVTELGEDGLPTDMEARIFRKNANSEEEAVQRAIEHPEYFNDGSVEGEVWNQKLLEVTGEDSNGNEKQQATESGKDNLRGESFSGEKRNEQNSVLRDSDFGSEENGEQPTFGDEFREPENEREYNASEVARRVSRGKSIFQVARRGDNSESRTMGYTFVKDGKIYSNLYENLPDGDIVSNANAGHEGFHGNLIDFAWDYADELALHLFDSFAKYGEYSESADIASESLLNSIIRSYFPDRPSADFWSLNQAERAYITNEFLAFASSGSALCDSAEAAGALDELQKSVQQFLVDVSICDEGAFEGVPTFSDYYSVKDDIVEWLNSIPENERDPAWEYLQKTLEVGSRMEGQNKYSEFEDTLNEMSRERDAKSKAKDADFEAKRAEDKQQTNAKEYAYNKKLEAEEAGTESSDEEKAKSTFGKDYEKVQKSADDFDGIKTRFDDEAFQKSDKGQDKKTRNKLKKLREAFRNAATTGDVETLFSIYEDLQSDSNLSNFYNEEIQEDIDNWRKLIDPNLDSYNEGAAPYAAARTMQKMAHKFAKANEYQQTLRKMNETLRGSRNGVLRKIGKSERLTASVARALMRWQVNPDTVFKMIDAFDKGNAGEGYKLAKELQEAHREKYRILREARAKFDKASDLKGYQDFAFGKQTVKDYSGREWDMRSALSVIQAIDTIRSTSGKKLGGTDGFGVMDSKGNVEFIDMKDVDAIKLYESLKSGLSDVAIKYGELATEAFNDVKEPLRAKYKQNNGVDIGMVGDEDARLGDKKGIEKAVYSPLSYVDKNGNVYQFDIAKQETYNNIPRFLRERSDAGGTYILIKPYTEVTGKYFEQVSNYLAYSTFNEKVRGLGKGSSYETGLGGTLADVFGKDMGNWYKSYVEDLQTYHNEDDVEGVNSLLRQGRQQLQQGALLGSVSVPMKQISSYWAASGILHPDSLIKNYRVKLFKPKNSSDAAIMLASRAMGNLEQSAAEAAKDAEKWLGKLKYSSKFVKFMANAINQMDYNTVSNLLSATEYDVLKYQFNNDKSKVGTEEYKAAVEELFQEVVDRSQPHFDKQMRAEYGRTDNEIVRMLSMFRTQQTQNLNLLATAIGEYQASKGTANQAKATETLKQTIAGQAASAFSLSMLTILADMLLHRQKKYEDEETEELDMSKILTRLGINAIEASSGTMWFGDTIAKWAIDRISGGKTKEFYGVNMGVISTVSDILENFENFMQNPSRSNAKYCAGNIATLMGIPLNNAYAMLNSAIMYGKDVLGSNEGDYDDILKYLDAQAKAAKKEEEKAAKAAAKAAEKSGADMLADASKQNSSQSELNSAEEQKAPEVSTYLKEPYNALVEAGMTPERSQYVLDFMDTDNNDSIKQSEMWAFYKDNPDYEDYVIAMWNSYGYKTTWEAYKAKHK